MCEYLHLFAVTLLLAAGAISGANHKCKNTLHDAAPPPFFWCGADGTTRYCSVVSREPVKSEQIAE